MNHFVRNHEWWFNILNFVYVIKCARNLFIFTHFQLDWIQGGPYMRILLFEKKAETIKWIPMSQEFLRWKDFTGKRKNKIKIRFGVSETNVWLKIQYKINTWTKKVKWSDLKIRMEWIHRWFQKFKHTSKNVQYMIKNLTETKILCYQKFNLFSISLNRSLIKK